MLGLNFLIKKMGQNPAYKKLLQSILQNKTDQLSLKFEGIKGSVKSLLITSLFNDIKQKNFSVLFITSSERESEEFYQDIKSYAPELPTHYFPDWEIMPYEQVSPFTDIIHHRILVLHHLLDGKPKLIITPIKALLRRIIQKKILLQNI
jgi:transcription-repair coupling factor (superfamily II helicase)